MVISEIFSGMGMPPEDLARRVERVEDLPLEAFALPLPLPRSTAFTPEVEGFLPDDLPPARREKYDHSGRNSKVLLKKLK